MAKVLFSVLLVACASRPPSPDACDLAIGKTLADCAVAIHEADEDSKAALRSECKERVGALPECK